MRRSLWIMFGGFCLLAGSEWLLAPLPLILRGSVLAAVGIAAVGVNRQPRWNSRRDVGGLAFGSVLILAVPEMVSGWALEHVSGNLSAAVFALIPLAVVLAVVLRGSGEGAVLSL